MQTLTDAQQKKIFFKRAGSALTKLSDFDRREFLRLFGKIPDDNRLENDDYEKLVSLAEQGGWPEDTFTRRYCVEITGDPWQGEFLNVFQKMGGRFLIIEDVRKKLRFFGEQPEGGAPCVNADRAEKFEPQRRAFIELLKNAQTARGLLVDKDAENFYKICRLAGWENGNAQALLVNGTASDVEEFFIGPRGPDRPKDLTLDDLRGDIAAPGAGVIYAAGMAQARNVSVKLSAGSMTPEVPRCSRFAFVPSTGVEDAMTYVFCARAQDKRHCVFLHPSSLSVVDTSGRIEIALQTEVGGDHDIWILIAKRASATGVDFFLEHAPKLMAVGPQGKMPVCPEVIGQAPISRLVMLVSSLVKHEGALLYRSRFAMRDDPSA